MGMKPRTPKPTKKLARLAINVWYEPGRVTPEDLARLFQETIDERLAPLFRVADRQKRYRKPTVEVCTFTVERDR
jgi:hypothetical protein